MQPPDPTSPADEYRQRLDIRTTELERLQRRFQRLGGARLGTFALLAAAAWWSVQFGAFAPVWLLLPAVLFAATVSWHGRVRRAVQTAGRAVTFYRHGLARVEDRWSGQGQQGSAYDDPHHVYAADLDLFGPGSLFELISAARTRMGERMLADWLLAPARAIEVRQRQQAVRELSGRLQLREDWAVSGAQDAAGVQPDALHDWACTPNRLDRTWAAPLAWVLPALLAGAVVLWAATGLLTPVLLVLLGQLGVMLTLREPLRATLATTEHALDDLELLTQLVHTIESARFESAALRDLTHGLHAGNHSAAGTLARLMTAAQLIESRRNPILRVLDVPLLFSVHAALAAERWRASHGTRVGVWLDTVGRFEALLSLSGFACEHPQDVFPEVLDQGPARFEATGLGHPLIPQARCVRNDVSVVGDTRVLLISGSNMSGKSTLLRAVGVATILAMAGAPVRAKSLSLTCLQVGASIRVNDSLQQGSSRFYAEITRLRQLQELASHEPPLLFLLDEVLQGTNSHDRLAGAEAIVRAFIRRGAIGLVTTHDLALTGISHDNAAQVRNLHFEDQLEHGRMAFDYRLRDGVVTKSNGIALMRSVGLDV